MLSSRSGQDIVKVDNELLLSERLSSCWCRLSVGGGAHSLIV